MNPTQMKHADEAIEEAHVIMSKVWEKMNGAPPPRGSFHILEQLTTAAVEIYIAKEIKT